MENVNSKRSYKEIAMLAIPILISLPKSMYYSIKYCGIKHGIKIPLLIHFTVKLQARKKNIKVLPKGMFSIKIGFGGSPNISHIGGTSIIVKKNGILTFDENIVISRGSKLITDGVIKIGKNFRSNKNLTVSCMNEIIIGNDVLIGWNCEIRDYDGHNIMYKEKVLSDNLPVSIANHVWIGAKSTILKGTDLPDDVVIGYGSIITSSNKFKSNTVIAGIPGKTIREDITWSI